MGDCDICDTNRLSDYYFLKRCVSMKYKAITKNILFKYPDAKTVCEQCFVDNCPNNSFSLDLKECQICGKERLQRTDKDRCFGCSGSGSMIKSAQKK